jgi:hypothetical protein
MLVGAPLAGGAPTAFPVRSGTAAATPALQRLNGFFTAHRRAIGTGICFAFATLLGAAGLHALA